LVQLGRFVARDRDQAQSRVILPYSSDGADAVQVRHVQVDDDGLRAQLFDELDRLDPVTSDPDDRQLRLVVDERPKGFDEPPIVVYKHDVDPPFGRRSSQLGHAARH
jgi:hypothetical protein